MNTHGIVVGIRQDLSKTREDADSKDRPVNITYAPRITGWILTIA